MTFDPKSKMTDEDPDPDMEELVLIMRRLGSVYEAEGLQQPQREVSGQTLSQTVSSHLSPVHYFLRACKKALSRSLRKVQTGNRQEPL